VNIDYRFTLTRVGFKLNSLQEINCPVKVKISPVAHNGCVEKWRFVILAMV